MNDNVGRMLNCMAWTALATFAFKIPEHDDDAEDLLYLALMKTILAYVPYLHTFRLKEIWFDAANNFVLFPNCYNLSDANFAVIQEDTEEVRDLGSGPRRFSRWVA